MELTEVREAEARLRRAILERDVAALDRLLAEDLVFVDPNGSVSGKAEDLGAHRSGDLVVESLEADEEAIRLLGPDSAALSVRVRLKFRYLGEPYSGTYRYLRVFAKRDGELRIVAAQATAVAGG